MIIALAIQVAGTLLGITAAGWWRGDRIWWAVALGIWPLLVAGKVEELLRG